MNKKIKDVLRLGIMQYRRFAYGTRSVARTTYLASASLISKDLVMGEYGYIGPRCEICHRVKVGNYVMFAPGVKIVGSDHNIDRVGIPMIHSGRPPHPTTIVEDDVWIATRVIVLAGVRIGCGSVIAAGSIVTKDVPENSIALGIPAKVIRNRFSTEEFSEHKKVITGDIIKGTLTNSNRLDDPE